MKSLQDEPFKTEDQEEFLTRISSQIDDIFRADFEAKNGQTKEEIITCENSLEYLSLSIQNRLKIESENGQNLPSSQIFADKLSKFQRIIDAMTQQKNEE